MDNNETPIANSILDVRQPFKVQDSIDKFKAIIKSGDVDALEAYTILKRMQKIPEEVFKDEEIKDLALDSFDKHLAGGKVKSVTLYSAQICKGATYTYYDFSECNHPLLNKITDLINSLTEEKKRIEEELKLLILSDSQQASVFSINSDEKEIIVPKTPKIVWEDSGEIVTVKAPRKMQKIGLKYLKM